MGIDEELLVGWSLINNRWKSCCFFVDGVRTMGCCGVEVVVSVCWGCDAGVLEVC